jgi:predicted enzyme related to lactoylglutathione lyase
VTTTPGRGADVGDRPALLLTVDCVTVPVPDLDSGLAFYQGKLGHELLWRDDQRGQAALRLPDSRTELVLTTRDSYAPGWLVASADRAVDAIREAGGAVVAEATDIPVGHLAVAADPFGNVLVLIDLSKGTYATDAAGAVTGLAAPPTGARD